MKLGSLFDGSGGFPLAATMSGITPVWASEVEPYPIAVTRSRFPKMKHLGDISRVNGAEIEPVDVITFGSPCQDMSVAGKRAGIKHEDNGDEETTRSGLFYEAIRIIKEMRENDKASGRAGVDIRPRYIVWENVPGAFSSNGGRDFRLVLEEIIKIAEPSAVMPDVPKGGWAYADSYRGDGWSVAYRVFDAQYWGVPQRRRRIYLVADFGGQCAQEIQFKRDRLQGYFAESREAWQAVTPDAERSPLTADREGGKSTAISMNWQAAVGAGLCVEEELTNPLSCTRTPAICFGISPYESNAMKSGNPLGMFPFRKSARARSADDATVWVDGDVANTLNTFDTGEARANELVVEKAVCYDARGNGDGGTASTLTGDHENRITDYTNVVTYGFDPGASRDVGDLFIEECSKTLTNGTCPGHHDGNAQYDFEVTESGVNSTIVAKGPGGVCYCIGNGQVHDAMHPSREVCNTLNCMVDPMKICYSVDAWNGTETPESIGALQSSAEHNSNSNNTIRQPCYWDGEQTTGTLTARNAGGAQRMPDKENFVAVIEQKPHYIVRRLTPTECARLQGFPDRWGTPVHKDEMTAEEYGFWREVRMTYDRINGRKEKTYTDAQILKWYNALHNDGAEYKMWGNGIALPCALYIMRGIVEVSK